MENTLHSICAQTSPHVDSLVACNERPIIQSEDLKNHPKIRYVCLERPTQSPRTGLEKELDKTRKVISGVNQLVRENQSGYFFMVDADDFINRDLARFVFENPGRNG